MLWYRHDFWRHPKWADKCLVRDSLFNHHFPAEISTSMELVSPSWDLLFRARAMLIPRQHRRPNECPEIPEITTDPELSMDIQLIWYRFLYPSKSCHLSLIVFSNETRGKDQSDGAFMCLTFTFCHAFRWNRFGQVKRRWLTRGFRPPHPVETYLMFSWTGVWSKMIGVSVFLTIEVMSDWKLAVTIDCRSELQ